MLSPPLFSKLFINYEECKFNFWWDSRKDMICYSLTMRNVNKGLTIEELEMVRVIH